MTADPLYVVLGHYGIAPIRILNGLSSVYFSKTSTWIIDGCELVCSWKWPRIIHLGLPCFLGAIALSGINKLTGNLRSFAQKFVILISAECIKSCLKWMGTLSLRGQAPQSTMGRWAKQFTGLAGNLRPCMDDVKWINQHFKLILVLGVNSGLIILQTFFSIIY